MSSHSSTPSKPHIYPPLPFDPSSDNQRLLRREIILGHLQIQRRRPPPYPSTHVIMTPVARTEPTPIIARLADRHTPQVRAHAQHDQPLGLLDAVSISLRVAQLADVDGFGLFDLGGGAVSDEDGLAAPFDDYLGSLDQGLGREGERWGERGCGLHFCLRG